MRRQFRRFSPADLLRSLMAEAAGGDGTFCSLSAATGGRSSAQNIHQRLKAPACDFLASVLAHRLGGGVALGRAGAVFPGRVLVEDCSHFQAHASLAGELPAHGNHLGATAGAKLHLVVDLVEGNMVNCSLLPATTSDQSLAHRVIEEGLQPGDLLLRDKGFFSVEALRDIEEKGAFYLSRLPKTLRPLDENDEAIDLPKLLARETREVVILHASLGRDFGLPSGLIALRVPKAVRRRRERECRQRLGRRRGRLPAWERFYCQWELMVTNLGLTEARAQALSTLYRCRWRIELIFKGMKSGNFSSRLAAKRTNKHHFLALLLARLLALALALPLETFLCRTRTEASAPPSLLKTFKLFFSSLRAFLLSQAFAPPAAFPSILKRAASMNKRKRSNHQDFFHAGLA